jgi:hypothetical protein
MLVTTDRRHGVWRETPYLKALSPVDPCGLRPTHPSLLPRFSWSAFVLGSISSEMSGSKEPMGGNVTTSRSVPVSGASRSPNDDPVNLGRRHPSLASG